MHRARFGLVAAAAVLAVPALASANASVDCRGVSYSGWSGVAKVRESVSFPGGRVFTADRVFTGDVSFGWSAGEAAELAAVNASGPVRVTVRVVNTWDGSVLDGSRVVDCRPPVVVVPPPVPPLVPPTAPEPPSVQVPPQEPPAPAAPVPPKPVAPTTPVAPPTPGTEKNRNPRPRSCRWYVLHHASNAVLRAHGCPIVCPRGARRVVVAGVWRCKRVPVRPRVTG